MGDKLQGHGRGAQGQGWGWVQVDGRGKEQRKCCPAEQIDYVTTRTGALTTGQLRREEAALRGARLPAHQRHDEHGQRVLHCHWHRHWTISYRKEPRGIWWGGRWTDGFLRLTPRTPVRRRSSSDNSRKYWRE